MLSDITYVSTSGTCLVGTGSQGRTRGNPRNSPAHKAPTSENRKPSTTVENWRQAERLQESKPVRNPKLQLLDQEVNKRCRRMQTRERRREERSNSELGLSYLWRSPVLDIDCIQLPVLLGWECCIFIIKSRISSIVFYISKNHCQNFLHWHTW